MATLLENNLLSEMKENEDHWKTNKIEFKNSYFNRDRIEGIGIALNSAFKLEKLFKLIVDITTDVLEAKYASVMLLERNTLNIKYSRHLPEELVEQNKVRVGEGISGWVALKGEPLLVKDIENHIRFKKKNNKRYSSKSFISMPIIHNKKVVGVINVNDKYNDKLFGDDDVEALKIISKYSAVAIRNVLLIRKSRKQTIIEELDNFYNDSANDFLPVSLQSLKTGPFSTEELYIESNNNGKNNYVLYWKGGNRLFVNEKREEFIRKNLNKLFVRKNGKKQYLRFMETNLERIIVDSNVSLKEKFLKANDIAISIFNDVSTALDGMCNIERTKHWVSLIIDFISSGQNHISTLVKTLRQDGHSYEHLRFVNVTTLGLIFAHHLGINIDELNKFGLGMFLQDIGMRKIDPLIINKPARLSKEEFVIVKKHPELGFQVLMDTGKLTTDSNILALLHHENFDGSGYPNGLKGNDIDYFGKISRVIDVYDALTCNKPYASANSPDKACMIMKDNMKGVFDSDILDSFIDFLGSVRITKAPISSNKPF